MSKKKYFIEIIITFIISLLYIFPYFIAKLGYVKIFIIVFFIILLYSIYKKLLDKFIYIFFIGVFISIIASYHTNIDLISSFGSTLLFIELFFLPIILVLDLLKIKNSKIYNILFYGILIIISIPFINSYEAYSLDHNLSRSLTAVSFLEEGVLETNFIKNIGSFNFVYSMGIIFLLIFYNFINSKQNIYKIINCIILVFFVVFFFNAGYSILFISLFISLFFMLIFFKTNLYKTMCFLLLFMLLYMFKANIFSYLNNIIDNPVFNLKLQHLIDASNNHGNIDDNIYRLKLYKLGLLCFFESPLFGSINSDLTYTCHSTIIGYLAKTGLIGTALYVYLYYFNIRLLLQYISKKEFITLFIPILIFTFIVSLFNPIDSAIQFGLFIFLLLPLYVLKNRKE